MLENALLQDANIITTTTDKHGDQIQSATTSIKCRFRYITEINQSNNQEALNTGADAIVWTSSDTAIAEGTIIQVDDNYWRIIRLVKARRLSSADVQFLKAYVVRHEL